VFSENHILNAANIGLQVNYGCHDGVIHGNTIGWVTDTGAGVGQGIAAIGGRRIAYVANVLDGGTAGGGNTGISSITDSTASPTVTSVGNVIVGNVITNFTHPVAVTPAAGDVVFQPSENASTGAITLPNGLEALYADAGLTATPSISFKTDKATGAYLPFVSYLGISNAGVNNFLFGPLGAYYQSAIATLNWTTGATNGTVDLRVSRSAAKTLQVDDGASGRVALSVLGSIRASAVAFANLPATPVEGMLVPVTDSNTAVWGATVAAGGANHILAYYDGTNWTVAAK
jgi:hypothetical protein